VHLGCEGSGEQRVKALPRPWRALFTFAFRKSLKRADKVIAVRTMGELGGAMQHLRGWGVPEERICFLPLAVKTWTRLPGREEARRVQAGDRKSTRLNSSHVEISYAVFCLKKKKKSVKKRTRGPAEHTEHKHIG